MNIKKILIIIISIIILILVIDKLIHYNRLKPNDKMIITQYDITALLKGNLLKTNEVVIDSKSDIKKIHNYVKKAKPVYLNLFLLSDIEIIYNNNVSIKFDTTNPGTTDLCDIVYKDTNSHVLCRVPEDFYKFVMEKYH